MRFADSQFMLVTRAGRFGAFDDARHEREAAAERAAHILAARAAAQRRPVGARLQAALARVATALGSPLRSSGAGEYGGER